MTEPADLPQAVRELAEACGFHVIRGMPESKTMLYGPLDALAVLVDLLLYEDRQVCSEALKLSVMAKSIAETPFVP